MKKPPKNKKQNKNNSEYNFYSKNSNLSKNLYRFPKNSFKQQGVNNFNDSDKISFKISNLFDKQYELIQDFPMPGRTFSIMLERTFQSN